RLPPAQVDAVDAADADAGDAHGGLVVEAGDALELRHHAPAARLEETHLLGAQDEVPQHAEREGHEDADLDGVLHPSPRSVDLVLRGAGTAARAGRARGGTPPAARERSLCPCAAYRCGWRCERRSPCRG